MLQNILNYDYLWIRLRVKGGAYGCMSGFGRDGDCYMVSYLDPKLAETNEVYDKLPEYLEQFDQDERSMDRYVIGAISEMDIPKNPAAAWCAWSYCVFKWNHKRAASKGAR